MHRLSMYDTLGFRHIAMRRPWLYHIWPYPHSGALRGWLARVGLYKGGTVRRSRCHFALAPALPHSGYAMVFVRSTSHVELPAWSVTRGRLRTVWLDHAAYLCCYMIRMCRVMLSLCSLAQLTLGGLLLIILAAVAGFVCNCLRINCPCSACGRSISSLLSISLRGWQCLLVMGHVIR